MCPGQQRLGAAHEGAGAQAAKPFGLAGREARTDSPKAPFHGTPWERAVSFLTSVEKGEG